MLERAKRIVAELVGDEADDELAEIIAAEISDNERALKLRLARLEHRALLVVTASGSAEEYIDELGEELLRRGAAIDCPACGAPGEAEHKNDCEVLR